MSIFNWKTFKHAGPTFKDLQTEEGETRLYIVDENTKLPSMTSVLGVLDDGGINDWVERVGEDEAKRIVDEAVARGNSLHDLSERYLKNELTKQDVKGPGAVLFNRSKKLLDELQLIIGIEVALYNVDDGYAGRVDCLAIHEGQFCVVDHKNSRKKIDFTKAYARKKIFKYMLQTCGYGRAFSKMFPHLPKPTHGLLIVGIMENMTSVKYKFELEPLEKELDILIAAYYNKGSIKDSLFFKM